MGEAGGGTRLKDERNRVARKERHVSERERERERDLAHASKREGERTSRTHRVRNARESLEPLSTTNEARCIAFAIRAVLICPDRLTLGKTLYSGLPRSRFRVSRLPAVSNQMRILRKRDIALLQQ